MSVICKLASVVLGASSFACPAGPSAAGDVDR